MQNFKQAYKLMCNQSSADNRNITKTNLLNVLSQIPIVSNFDNATTQEKAQGKLKKQKIMIEISTSKVYMSI